MNTNLLETLKKGETFYRGYIIKPSDDFGFRERGITGFVVVYGPGHEYEECNAMPGGCGFENQCDALDAIDVLEFVGGEGNSEHFWELMQPPLVGYKVGEASPDNMEGFPANGTVSCGRWYVVQKDGVVTKIGITKVMPWDGKPGPKRPHLRPDLKAKGKKK